MRLSVVILAAGAGRRMGEPEGGKVLLPLAGRAMLSYVLESAHRLKAEKAVLVLGKGMEAARRLALEEYSGIKIVRQMKPQGTGDALERALVHVKGSDCVVVLYGDTPLVRPETARKLAKARFDVSICGFETSQPKGYGRLVEDESGSLVGIEEDDGRPLRRGGGLCNAGFMALSAKALGLVKGIAREQRNGERYLTALAGEESLTRGVVRCEEEEAEGANSLEDLARLEGLMQKRLRKKALGKGVMMTAPETVFLSYDTFLGQGARIDPYVVFGKGVRIEGGASVRSFCHIEGAHVKAGASVGPFARLREGAVAGKGSHVGNFVEVKKSRLGEGAKAGHLSYIGDAEIGAEANIGAGVVTCNYDGKQKHKTQIGKGAFIGSNSSLVAPVRVGKDGYVGSGSVITQDVPKGFLALGRARQVNKAKK